jgi:hypothetical protein
MAKLTAQVRITASDRQIAALERIDKEDFNLVVYKTKKAFEEREIHPPEIFFEDGIMSLKQYYCTTIFDPYNCHAVADNLDRFWHEHVLDTARYSILCRDLKGFMHHDPLDRRNLDKVAAIGQVYLYTYKVLVKIFGKKNLSEDFFPEKPEIDILVCRHDVHPIPDTKTAWDDVFPVNKTIEEIREKYGNQAKIAEIEGQLKKNK